MLDPEGGGALAAAEVVGVVFARGGSKGIPRKNLAPLRGVPLVGRAIQMAQACASIDRVMVSTEDDEIARVASHFGAEVPWMRPPELATDDSPEWEAWRHWIRACNAGGIAMRLLVAVPPTSPLREEGDIEGCIQAVINDEKADVGLVVSPARRNPWFNMVRLDDAGYAQPLDRGTRPFRRQDAPRVYDLTSVAFVARPHFVLSAAGLFEGRVKATSVPSERALDIDDPLDLWIADCLMERRTKGGS